jgi:hypothetical protein
MIDWEDRDEEGRTDLLHYLQSGELRRGRTEWVAIAVSVVFLLGQIGFVVALMQPANLSRVCRESNQPWAASGETPTRCFRRRST